VFRLTFRAAAVCLALLGWVDAPAQSPAYGVGRPPSGEEIRAWDISVDPEGNGLPEGSGTAAEGEAVYRRRCSECHGEKGEGSEEAALVGKRESLQSARPLKTVGSYWPYATTLWDYVNRSMPFDQPGILTAGQVYAVTAYVLFLNGIVGENEELNERTLPEVRMPNRDGFVPAEELGPEFSPSRPSAE